ncbi:MAG TPA: hypothetical protein VGD65_10110 [Chryseosolibacter sp.]
MSNATDPKIDSLKKLGRSALIEMAVAKMAKDYPDFDHTQYDRTFVKANDKSLIVEFQLSVAIKRGRSCYYDVVWVALAGHGSGASTQGFCDDVKYYKRTDRDMNVTTFVFNAINKSDKIGDIKDNKLPSGTKMTIRARGLYYHVETSSWSTHSNFRVNKITGGISGARHKHYMRRRDEKPEWEYIGD